MNTIKTMDKKNIIIIGLIIVVFLLISTIAITLNQTTQSTNNTIETNKTSQSNTVTVESVTSDNSETQSESSSSQESDPGAFYSAQSEKMIYTGDIQELEGHHYKHLGYNKWEQID